MCMGEPLQRLVVKFFIFFHACTQLYIYIPLQIIKYASFFFVVFILQLLCVSTWNKYLTAVCFFLCCYQYSMEEDVKCMKWKGAVGGNRWQVQRSVRGD